MSTSVISALTINGTSCQLDYDLLSGAPDMLGYVQNSEINSYIGDYLSENGYTPGSGGSSGDGSIDESTLNAYLFGYMYDPDGTSGAIHSYLFADNDSAINMSMYLFGDGEYIPGVVRSYLFGDGSATLSEYMFGDGSEIPGMVQSYLFGDGSLTLSAYLFGDGSETSGAVSSYLFYGEGSAMYTYLFGDGSETTGVIPDYLSWNGYTSESGLDEEGINEYLFGSASTTLADYLFGDSIYGIRGAIPMYLFNDSSATLSEYLFGDESGPVGMYLSSNSYISAYDFSQYAYSYLFGDTSNGQLASFLRDYEYISTGNLDSYAEAIYSAISSYLA